MRITTIQLPEDLADDLEAEADANDYDSLSAYIQDILSNRGEYEPNTQEETEAKTDRIPSEYAQRLEELERRVAVLESQGDTAYSEGNTAEYDSEYRDKEENRYREK